MEISPRERDKMKLTACWTFVYECDKEEAFDKNADIEKIFDDPESYFKVPNEEETQCIEAYIWRITDEEGEEVYAR